MYSDSEWQELFVADLDYTLLDHCIDDARSWLEDLFSLAKLIRGQPSRKKQSQN
jgi:hypothetical protein